MSRNHGLRSGELRELFKANKWFQLPKKFLLILPPDEALMLAYLIDLAGMKLPKVAQSNLFKQDESEDVNEWFYCPRNRVADDLYFTYEQQRRFLSRLTKRGYVYTKMFNCGDERDYKRFVRIDTSIIAEDIIRAQKKFKDKIKKGEIKRYCEIKQSHFNRSVLNKKPYKNEQYAAQNGGV